MPTMKSAALVGSGASPLSFVDFRIMSADYYDYSLIRSMSQPIGQVDFYCRSSRQIYECTSFYEEFIYDVNNPTDKESLLSIADFFPPNRRVHFLLPLLPAKSRSALSIGTLVYCQCLPAKSRSALSISRGSSQLRRQSTEVDRRQAGNHDGHYRTTIHRHEYLIIIIT